MREKEFLEYMQAVDEAHRKYPTWRRGQAYMNTLARLHPEIELEVTATECDPFYDDAAIPKLLNFLMKTMVEGDASEI